MKYKLGKHGIFAGVLAVIMAVCVALGIYFLLPETSSSVTAYADDSVINHSSSDHSDSNVWNTLTSDTTTLSGGNYYLSGNVTTSSTITVSETVYLCLNGYALIYGNTNSASVITVSGGATLYLCDCGGETEQTHYFYEKSLATEYVMENNDEPYYYNYCNSTGDGCGDTHQQYSSAALTSNKHIEVTGGVITGGTGSTYGGGIYTEGGTVYMYGGTIVGNNARYGGGISVTGTGTASGALNMYGGAIMGNAATTYGGGGVYVNCTSSSARATFNMYGGTISANRAAASSGGVYVWGGGSASPYYTTFNMYGGTILGDNYYYSYQNLGDVGYVLHYVTVYIRANFNITGGYLAGETTLNNYSDLNITGGYFTTNSYTLASGYEYKSLTTNNETWKYIVVPTSHIDTVGGSSIDFSANYLDELTYSRQNSISLTGGSAGYTAYYLITDLNADITITGGTVYLCLYGRTLTGTGGNSSVITVSDGATLYLCDCDGSTAGSGMVTGGAGTTNSGVEYGGAIYVKGTLNMEGGTVSYNEADYGGGVYVTGDSASFNMSGGTISANSAQYGGGVAVVNGGSFIMSGTAVIIDNQVTHTDSGQTAYGGGVYVADAGSSFTMNGGTISGNSAKNSGGGVYVVGGDNSNTASFIMTNGTIGGTADDTANTSQAGAGVYVYTYATFEMSGGTITGNTASDSGNGNGNGGGVDVNGGTFTMSGTATVSGNSADYGVSVYVSSGDSGIYAYFYMNGGYLGGSVHRNSADTVQISGGYLDSDAYNSILDSNGAVQYLADSKVVLYLPDFDAAPLNIDGNYVADFNYAVYGTSSGSGKYNQSYSGNADYSSDFISTGTNYTYVQYYYNNINVTADGLPVNASNSAYTIIAYGVNPQSGSVPTVVTYTYTVTINVKTVSVVWSVKQGTTTPDSYTVTYNGNAWEISASAASEVNDETINVNVAIQSGDSGTSVSITNANEYTITASIASVSGGDANNYTLSDNTITFIVKKADVSGSVEGKSGLTYNGGAQELVTSSVSGGTVSYSLGTDGIYDASIPRVTDAGTYTVYYKITGDDNHNDVATNSIQVTISAYTITSVSWGYSDGDSESGTIDDGSKNVDYNGNSWTITATAEGKNGETVYITYTINNGDVTGIKNAATYTIKATEIDSVSSSGLKSNYKLSDSLSEVTFTVNKVDIININWSYNGGESGTFTNSASVKYCDGGYTITATAKGVGEESFTVMFTVTLNGSTGEGAASATLTTVGEYTLTVTSISGEGVLADNYTTSSYQDKNVKFTIANTAGSVTITVSSLDRTYNSNTVSFTRGSDYTVVGDGDVTVSWYKKDAEGNWVSIGTAAPSDVGDYKVEVTLAETASYSGASAAKEFTISPAELTVVWSGNSFSYNGEVQMPTVSAATGLVGNEVLEDLEIYYTGDTSVSAVGSYTITAVLGNDNYTIADGSDVCSFEIVSASASGNGATDLTTTDDEYGDIYECLAILFGVILVGGFIAVIVLLCKRRLTK